MNDVQGFTWQIEKLIANKGLRERLGKMGVKEVEQYSWERVGERVKVRTLLRSVVELGHGVDCGFAPSFKVFPGGQSADGAADDCQVGGD